jgi:hypothetical protein
MLSEINIKFCASEAKFGGGGGLHSPICFLSISSSWVNIRLHTENQLHTLPGSALKVCVVGGGGGGGWC